MLQDLKKNATYIYNTVDLLELYYVLHVWGIQKQFWTIQKNIAWKGLQPFLDT